MLPDGFAELAAIWPKQQQLRAAAALYRKALGYASAGRLQELARQFLADKEPWRECMYLVNWLRTEPWRDPMLPLTAPPRAVEDAAPPADEAPPHPFGNAIATRLVERIGAAAFANWFGAVTADISPDLVTIVTPSRFVRDRLARHYEADLAAAWGRRVEVVVTKRERRAG